MRKIRIRWAQFKIRLRVCWRIMTLQDRHWFVCAMSENDVLEFFKDGDFHVILEYHKLDEYVVKALLKKMGTQLDDIDIMLAKAKFEAEASLVKRK